MWKHEADPSEHALRGPFSFRRRQAQETLLVPTTRTLEMVGTVLALTLGQ